MDFVIRFWFGVLFYGIDVHPFDDHITLYDVFVTVIGKKILWSKVNVARIIYFRRLIH